MCVRERGGGEHKTLINYNEHPSVHTTVSVVTMSIPVLAVSPARARSNSRCSDSIHESNSS